MKCQCRQLNTEESSVRVRYLIETNRDLPLSDVLAVTSVTDVGDGPHDVTIELSCDASNVC